MAEADGAGTGPCPPDAPPDFSIVVPVYRQWHLVPALLAALAAQRLAPGRAELVLVNNDPAQTPPPLPASPPLPARLVACPAPGAYAARNAGAAAARGAWLVFTDADCRPEPGWLAALARAAAASPGALLAGPVRVTSDAARPNACEIYEVVRGIPQASYVARGYAATANLALPAGLFRALGGFDPGRFSGGDAAFCRRAGAAGHPLRLVEDAVVGHPARADWPALARKARRIKGGQIAAGPLPRRLAWTLRTLAPPLRDAAAFLRRDQPLPRRLTAIALRFGLWGVELAETLRLLAGARPERE
jgi:glycosyltransferase involved in cell wall biosynthesis